MGQGVREMGEIGKGIKKYTQAIIKQSWEYKAVQHREYSRNIVKTMQDATWVLYLLGTHFLSYINILPLCYIPETNIMLNIDCN